MRSDAAAFGFLLSVLAVPVAAQDISWTAETATRLDNLHDVTLSHGGERVIVHAGSRRFRLSLPRGLYLLSPLKDDGKANPDDTIPGGRVATGNGIIASARLTGPTDRYPHGVLGDGIEAETLSVRFRAGGETAFSLPGDSVFEDLEPRLIVLDGQEAVLAVRSYRDRGAALAVFGVADGTLSPLAESPPIGAAFRWQNPVGAADFDGDGRTEIASVVTPHLSGILTLYRRNGTVLEPVASAAGYSNHFIGSTVLGMHQAADVDGDGITDIVLPSLDRRRLTAVTFAGGRTRVLHVVENPAPIVTAIVMADLDRTGAPEIVYGLANGAIMVVRR